MLPLRFIRSFKRYIQDTYMLLAMLANAAPRSPAPPPCRLHSFAPHFFPFCPYPIPSHPHSQNNKPHHQKREERRRKHQKLEAKDHRGRSVTQQATSIQFDSIREKTAIGKQQMSKQTASQDIPDEDGGKVVTGTPAQVRMRLTSDDVRSGGDCCSCCCCCCFEARSMLPMLLDRRGTVLSSRCCAPPAQTTTVLWAGDGLAGVFLLLLLLEKAARSEWPYHMSLFSSSSLSYRLLWLWP